MSKTKKIPFRPIWPGPIEGHAVNTARYYYGHLHAWHEFDDLLQEAYIVFIKCKRAYAGTVDNPAWFMALFRNSLRNRFSTLLQHGPRYNFIEDLESINTDAAGDLKNDGYLRCILEDLPPVLNMMLRLAVRDKVSPQRRRATRRHMENWLQDDGVAPAPLLTRD